MHGNGRLLVERAGQPRAAAVTTLLTRFFLEEGFAVPPGGLGPRVERFLATPANAVFTAGDGTAVVGVATVTTGYGLEFGLSAELEDLYVLPEARGVGVAGRLIAAAADWSRGRGCTRLEVCVTPAGQQAHDLVGWYARRGFVDDGRRLLGLELEAPEGPASPAL